MHDRTLMALAAIPMLSGAALLVALSRLPPARHSASPRRPQATRVATHSSADVAWLGVVLASHKAELASALDGRVSEVWVNAGTRVAKGQPILQIDREDAELESARAERVAHAEPVSARAGATTGQGKFAQQRLRARHRTVAAPFDGVLANRDVDRGDSVSAGQLLAEVISDDRQVRFAFPREHLPESGSMDVELVLPGSEVRATVENLRPEIDPAVQMIFATAPLPAHAWNLVPGTRVVVGPTEKHP